MESEIPRRFRGNGWTNAYAFMVPRKGMVGREEGEDEPVALSWKRRAISKTIPLVYPCVGRL